MSAVVDEYLLSCSLVPYVTWREPQRLPAASQEPVLLASSPSVSPSTALPHSRVPALSLQRRHSLAAHCQLMSSNPLTGACFSHPYICSCPYTCRSFVNSWAVLPAHWLRVQSQQLCTHVGAHSYWRRFALTYLFAQWLNLSHNLTCWSLCAAYKTTKTFFFQHCILCSARHAGWIRYQCPCAKMSQVSCRVSLRSMKT